MEWAGRWRRRIAAAVSVRALRDSSEPEGPRASRGLQKVGAGAREETCYDVGDRLARQIRTNRRGVSFRLARQPRQTWGRGLSRWPWCLASWRHG